MYEYRCKIVRVVDGDTVDVDIDLGFGMWIHKERIRVYGIDTPESRTRDSTEKIFGKLATEAVKSFLPEGSMQTLRTVRDKTGKFGRVLGQFIIYDPKEDRQTTLNEWMVNNHFAVKYNGQSKREVAHAHLKNFKKLAEGLDDTIINKAQLAIYINSNS